MNPQANNNNDNAVATKKDIEDLQVMSRQNVQVMAEALMAIASRMSDVQLRVEYLPGSFKSIALGALSWTFAIAAYAKSGGYRVFWVLPVQISLGYLFASLGRDVFEHYSRTR